MPNDWPAGHEEVPKEMSFLMSNERDQGRAVAMVKRKLTLSMLLSRDSGSTTVHQGLLHSNSRDGPVINARSQATFLE